MDATCLLPPPPDRRAGPAGGAVAAAALEATFAHDVQEDDPRAADSFTMHGLLKHLFDKRDELVGAASLAAARDAARLGFMDKAPPAATPVVAEYVPKLVDALAQFYYAGFIIPPGSIKLGDVTRPESLVEVRAAGQGGEVPAE